MKTSKVYRDAKTGFAQLFSKALPTLLIATALTVAHAQTANETVLHHFNPSQNDGASPYSGVIIGNDGALYGTTWGGGTNAAGTVFRMNKDGSGYTILHYFDMAPDGSVPFAGLMQANDGMLYGTTYNGGTNLNGTIFRINTNGGNYSVLYRFTNSPDGANPYAGLIQGLDGALYGTTQGGGGSSLGTIFKINPGGSGYSILHTFTSFPDGSVPYGGLVQASDGVLYGTTYSGGSNILGTVFRISTNGGGYSEIHSFGGSPNGASLESGLLLANDGWLYGTTVIGGTKGYGTVFRVNTNGSGFATLRSFTNSPDGANGYASLAQGSDGLIYGVTTWGGNTNAGTIFRMNTNGANYSVLYHFKDDDIDGRHPMAGLVSAGNGVFYGTTLQGGTNGFGTVYRFALLPDLGISLSAPGFPQVTLTSFPGQQCQLQASSNLINWNSLTNLTLTNGTAQVTDSNSANVPVRFYRALVQ